MPDGCVMRVCHTVACQRHLPTSANRNPGFSKWSIITYTPLATGAPVSVEAHLLARSDTWTSYYGSRHITHRKRLWSLLACAPLHCTPNADNEKTTITRSKFHIHPANNTTLPTVRNVIDAINLVLHTTLLELVKNISRASGKMEFISTIWTIYVSIFCLWFSLLLLDGSSVRTPVDCINVCIHVNWSTTA